MADKQKKRHHHHQGEDIQEGNSEEAEDIKSFIDRWEETHSRKEEALFRKQEELHLRKQKEEREYRAQMEEREEKRAIAAEERAEARVIAAKVAEEERAEARAEAKAQRKVDEARRAEEWRLEESKRQEELEKAREEAAREASEELRAQQEAAEKRAYEQQVSLVRMQAEIGEKVAETHRQEGQKARKRDRAVQGIPTYREPEDVEDFLQTSERKLSAGEIPEKEWAGIIAAKLSGKVGTTWHEACVATDDYQLIKGGVLKNCGYTPKLAGEAFFGFKAESLKGLAADQVYSRGAQLLRRMVAPEKLSAHVEFCILKPWIWASVGRRCRMVLDARAVTSSEELLVALQDYLVSDGERAEGQAAVFKGEGQAVSGFRKHTPQGEGGAEKRKGSGGGGSGFPFTCFKCGKAGHKAADCWHGGAAPPNPNKAGSGLTTKVSCYTCGVEGHKSTTCPKRDVTKEGGTKSVRQLWLRDSRDTVIDGEVNGAAVTLLLDSGAHISIVPEDLVGGELRTGECVLVRPFQSKTPLSLPTAKVRFQIGGLKEWEEIVALAPVEQGKESEVLYGLDLKSTRGLDLVILANKMSQSGVLRVTTRARSKQEAQEEKQAAEEVAYEKPRVEAVGTEAAEPVGKLGAGEGRAAADRPVVLPEPVSSEVEVKGSEKSTEIGEPAADRPVGNPGPVTQEVPGVDEWPDLDFLEEEGLEMEEEGLEMEEEEQVDLPGEVEYCLRGSEDELEDLQVPPVEKGLGSRPELVKEVHKDPTLQGWRELAERGEQGFKWERGLLYQTTTNHMSEVIHLMVLPKMFRGKVLEMAHEGSGHLGARKVKALLKQRFIWPGMGVEVIANTRSCRVCQRCARPKSRKAPMMERQVMTEPFEVMAFDLVGPLPKGKGGCRFILTAVCMGSRWPEAIPLRTITARAVATGMIEIFARTGIPLQLLTDQGSQFLGRLVSHLCRDLGIDQVKTAPYHPETNGVVERMHGTLKPMLTKASQLGLDWVDQLPFALFALRSAPNRDSSFSPYQLIYGHRVRTPLDILHQGWADLSFEELNTEEWSEWLVDRLEVWHSIQRERMKEASGKRKSQFDKGTVDRQLEVGDKVLCRIPGIIGKLKEAWHGPYVVEAKMGRVNYKVKVGKGRAKTLHINNLKRFYERNESVLRLALVAEDWSEDEVVGTKMFGSCRDFDEVEVVRMLKGEFPEVFSDLPGRTDACKLEIDTGSAAPRGSHPYRIPNKLKDGVRSEVEKLVELGIVVPSTSPWASPVVPVPKGDGTVRVCVDYRKLNEVTTADPYYMTTMEEILERVGESRVMSKLDLAKGFYQVEVEPLSQEKTAFISPFGKFEFTRMPFGLKNAPAIFQRLMEVVLRDCYHCSAPYIDDIVVFSSSGAEHIEHLRSVLSALRKYGMTLKESKCEFGKEKVEYLGHVIGGGELAVPAHRAAAMANYLKPKTKKQLRSFLGAAGYYRQFVEGYAKLSSVLSPWTSKSAPSVVGWTVEGLEAFDKIKVSLVNCCCLTIPTQEDTFTLHCDASGAGIGATLNVWRDGKERPVAFYSKQLQGAQHYYSATELEGLAVFKSVHFFAHYLYGCRFKVVTDHKALVSFLHSRELNRRLHGWVLQLLQFDFEITYRPGRENGDADALSRQAWDSRTGDPWQLEPGEEKEKGLRPAPSSVVGGDVGITHIEEGGATSGVAPKTEGGAATGSGAENNEHCEQRPTENRGNRVKA